MSPTHSPRARRRAPAVLAAAALAATPLLAATPAAAAVEVVVRATEPLVHVEDGRTARVTVAVEITGGAALTDAVRVSWRTGRGTATAGRDYAAASGTLTFPAGA